MPDIALSSHDLLGKLTILKNSLFMLDRKNENDKLDSDDKEYLETCYKTVEEMIEMVKEKSEQ